MRRHLRTCATVAVILAAYGMCSPAAASLVYYATAQIGGTGIGNVVEILEFPSAPGQDAYSGCVKWAVTGNAFGGLCPDELFGNDQSTTKSTTRTPSEVSATITPFTLAIIFNPSEPGNNNDIWVDRMVLTFYDPLVPSTHSSYSLPSPVYFPVAGTGGGSAGHVFGLDWDQARDLTLWLAQNSLVFTDVRMGLGAETSDQQGKSYFFIGQFTEQIPVPEPLSAGLVAAGLLALGLRRRRSAKTS